MHSNRLVKDLNDLLEYLYDSQKGFSEAAQQVADLELKNIFDYLSQQRKLFSENLKNEIRKLGGEPIASGSVIAVAHRLYVDLKALLTGGDIKAIVGEVKRGENTLLQRYQAVSDKEMPAHARGLLLQQMQEIENYLAEITALAEGKRKPNNRFY